MTPSSQAELERLRLEQLRLERELEETNRGVVALYAELEDKAEALRRADETKSRFLSRVSHELRTPINSILALSQLLVDRADGELNDEQATQVEFIRAAAGELSVLVNDLLDLAKIEAGRVEVYLKEFPLSSVFASLTGSLRPLAKPGVELVFEPVDDLPPLMTDDGKVAQIVRNFVTNALKFTSAGEVRVRGAFLVEDQRVRVEVRDTGVGIAAEDLDRIFDEFTQVAGIHQAGIRGTGLGLPVSRGLAEVLGGAVGVESVVGSGSTFWVEIPAIHPDAIAAVVSAEGGPTSARVLVIDDDPVARYVARQQLTRAGMAVVEASGAVAGLAMAHEHAVDAIVLDLSMPELDGIDVHDRLRADPLTAHTPILVHTARELDPAERGRLRHPQTAIASKALTAEAFSAALATLLPGRSSDG